MKSKTYKYKFKGVFCPYLMQLVFAGFLGFFWTVAIRSGAPAIGLVIAGLITFFIIGMVYKGYPAKFNLNNEGMKIIFSFGDSVFFKWENIENMQITGPSAVIEVESDRGWNRIFNKYYIFLWFLEENQKFRDIISENVK
ncbi:MAG: hypothetical protein ACQEQC_08565 [Elusimicrobiota bacterium]